MSKKERSGRFNLRALLVQYKQGSHKDYDEFVNILSDPQTKAEDLRVYLRGIKENVTELNREFEDLVAVLLKLDWPHRELSVVREYQSLLVGLVCVHSYYLRASLRMLVKYFTPAINKSAPDTEVSMEIQQTNEAVFLNIHMVLKAILDSVPMSSTVLLPLLHDLFPFLGKAAYIQECYIRNLLQITTYLPSARQRILELVIDRMLKLDVRAPRQDIQETEGDEEDMEEGIVFDMDFEQDLTRDLENKDGCIFDRKRSDKPMTHREANILDVCMEMTLTYISNVCYTNGECNWEATKKLYREVLLVFDRLILPTHASCHVQFIMFYLCSTKLPICEGFIDYLWKKVQNPNTESVFRQAAVGYMGSLLSRAMFVPLSTVTACLDLMCEWIHLYLDNTSEEIVNADVSHHGPFYSVCQAVFYVFVFRNKEIFEWKKGHKWAEILNFQRIVTCRLNPLRVCLPVIVKMFSSISRMHQLAFCDTIIERNKRCILPVTSNGVGTSSVLTELDSYFPFDPYLLNRSGRFIIPLYREYKGSIEEDQELSDGEDDFLQEEQLSSTSESLPQSMSLSKTPKDFLHYGISPGFKHIQDVT
ncbi:RNA polymerase I-specific transcription initiation factor RRN3-like [Saccostrea echinata]|uniref:RNA polymerase I-specific transcription initiation factor RRN3-like n=1 Tax=Saccostrea echinata TaxID=191078 RepID=UPI002A81BF29|nr:RNA polymerase I-specific transcription initiation factor RRN3-like [Saccostrea echinata]